MIQTVPDVRISRLNSAPLRRERGFVLYWMTAFRRLESNFALQRAVELVRETGKPLLVVETLDLDEPWSSSRFHQFVLDGMRDNLQRAQATSLSYLAVVERQQGDSVRLISRLTSSACGVVIDDFPSHYQQSFASHAAAAADVAVEAVDSNGLLPLRAADKVFSTAFAFRKHLQRSLVPHLKNFPRRGPLEGLSPVPIKLPPGMPSHLPALEAPQSFDSLPFDTSADSVEIRGGPSVAADRLRLFLDRRIAHYAEERNDPGHEATSGLSPYLHFGHISVHDVFRSLMKQEYWAPDKVSTTATGHRTGWWGVGENAESFLDELVTWRELGYNMAWQSSDYDRYESLPEWARQTLEEHLADPRQYVYSLRRFENAETHDDLWNAAQIQLRREGTIHTYLRMLWGKKILEWTRHPKDALEIMIELNNKFALDGRDPNSYSGIFWILGRYDRPWGPERPVFGKVRYMSSANTRRKYSVKDYIARYRP